MVYYLVQGLAAYGPRSGTNPQIQLCLCPYPQQEAVPRPGSWELLFFTPAPSCSMGAFCSWWGTHLGLGSFQLWLHCSQEVGAGRSSSSMDAACNCLALAQSPNSWKMHQHCSHEVRAKKNGSGTGTAPSLGMGSGKASYC